MDPRAHTISHKPLDHLATAVAAAGVVAAGVAGVAGVAGESEWEITPEEFSCYFTRYQHITSPGQYLCGE